MQGKKLNRKGRYENSIPVETGFYYSPINTAIRPNRSSHPIKRNKQHTAEFAVANYQIVLKEACNSDKYIYDANGMIQWEDVSSMKCTVQQDDCCPICLMPYSVPRVTKCGHIFCYSCILYYIRKEDDTCIKCPVCSQHFFTSELKPAELSISNNSIQENTRASFTLVVRDKSCVNGFPFDSPAIQFYLQNPLPLANDKAEDIRFCHYLLYSLVDEYKRVEQELIEINRSEKEMMDSNDVLTLGSLYLVKDEIQKRHDVIRSCFTDIGEISYERDKDLVHPNMNMSSLLFYYIDDHLPRYYLHPLSMKCLRSQFSSYASLPPHITSTVLEIDPIIVNEEQCVKNPTIRHFPNYTTVYYVEIAVFKLLKERLSDRLYKEVKGREEMRKRRMSMRKREERWIDKQVKQEEKHYIEEYTPYMIPVESEEIDITDKQSWPSLPAPNDLSVATPSISVASSVWSTQATIGVNTTLKAGLREGRFPSLSESMTPTPAPILDWSKVTFSQKQENEKKKPKVIVSF